MGGRKALIQSNTSMQARRTFNQLYGNSGRTSSRGPEGKGIKKKNGTHNNLNPFMCVMIEGANFRVCRGFVVTAKRKDRFSLFSSICSWRSAVEGWEDLYLLTEDRGSLSCKPAGQGIVSRVFRRIIPCLLSPSIAVWLSPCAHKLAIKMTKQQEYALIK